MKNFPSKEQVLEWIKDNPGHSSKREISRAFGIKGQARIELKKMLRILSEEGHLSGSRKSFHAKGTLPPVSVLQISGLDGDGEVLAEPMEWEGDEAKPVVIMIPRKGNPALKKGDRVLARLTPAKTEDVSYEGRLIRRIGTGSQKILGLYRQGTEGGRIIPIDKKADREWAVHETDRNGAKDGELVEAEKVGGKARMGLPKARVVERLGDPMAPRSISLIAIHQHGIPDAFPNVVIAESEAARQVGLGKRTDLRQLPLFTIDPSDARDHDDAICAIPDENPKNAGGFVVWVAIADVAHYVRPGTALDREARHRGNSCYFPDRVVPMLPDALSGDL